MGPCIYCKEMIYLDWVAERGYHRDCHEHYMKKLEAGTYGSIQWRIRTNPLNSVWLAKQVKIEHKRRLRRGQIKSMKWRRAS